MNLRIRFISLLMALFTFFGFAFSSPAFADYEASSSPEETVDCNSANNLIAPYGSLSGYGYVWHNEGESVKSSPISVTGTPWHQGHLTIGLDNFNSNTRLKIWVFSPITDSSGTKNQTIFYRENVTINDGPWENISFNPAVTGTYWVQCEVMSNDSSGRVNCWIY